VSCLVDNNFFANRLTQLREQQGLSARDMSLSLGQNENYINKIENKHTLPSMSAFFNICDFLKVTPQEFFDGDNICPKELNHLIKNLKKLDKQSLLYLSALIEKMTEHK
jgi:transcriptional regulator with XRE-family HTH domain